MSASVFAIWGFSKASRAITFRHLLAGIRFRFITFFLSQFWVMCVCALVCVCVCVFPSDSVCLCVCLYATMNSRNYRTGVGKLWFQMNCSDVVFLLSWFLLLACWTHSVCSVTGKYFVRYEEKWLEDVSTSVTRWRKAQTTVHTGTSMALL